MFLIAYIHIYIYNHSLTKVNAAKKPKSDSLNLMISRKFYACMALHDLALPTFECYIPLNYNSEKSHYLEYTSYMEMDVQEHVSSMKLYSMYLSMFLICVMLSFTLACSNESKAGVCYKDIAPAS